MKIQPRPIPPRTRSMLAPLVATLALVAGPSADARADLTLAIESVNIGDAGFEVYLTNTGPSAVSVDTTQFEITVSSAQVDLTSATTGTTKYPYIFAGNSLFGPTINTSSGQTLDASDSTVSGDVSIAADSSVGLGYVLFTITGTVSYPITLSFNTDPNFTSLADQGNNVPITSFQNGSISVPEPASIVQATVAILLGGLFVRRRPLRRP